MSHSVTIYIGDLKQEILISCDENINSLKKSLDQNYDDSFKKELLQKANELLIIRDKMLALPDYSNDLKIEKEMDHLTKLTSNIISSISNAEYFYKKYGEEISIVDIISEYGVLGVQSIRFLEEKSLRITKENLLNAMNEIRNINVNKENKKEFIENINKFIDSQNFESDEIRYQLKTIVREFNTPQEMVDAYAYIKAKKIEIENIFNLKNNVFNELKKLNFIIDDKYKVNIDTMGLMCLTYKMRNAFNNTIEIIFRGDGSFSYKLGNYIGHACEKTTDKLLNYLEAAGFKIKHKTITRNIDNSKPLYKEMKLKFRGE